MDVPKIAVMVGRAGHPVRFSVRRIVSAKELSRLFDPAA